MKQTNRAIQSAMASASALGLAIFANSPLVGIGTFPPVIVSFIPPALPPSARLITVSNRSSRSRHRPMRPDLASKEIFLELWGTLTYNLTRTRPTTHQEA
jgi:hypothetical protein